MIILSNKVLNVNFTLKKNNTIESFSILKESDIDENQLFFLHKTLVDFNEDITDLVDDLYTVAYYCKVIEDDIFILNKVYIERYTDIILNVLMNKKYDFRCYTATYIEEFAKYNPEFKKFILTKLDILLKIFKDNLDESIDSVSSILSVIKILNINNEDFLSNLSIVVKDCMDRDILYSKETLIDLIELCKILKDFNLEYLEEKLDKLLKENLSELPF